MNGDDDGGYYVCLANLIATNDVCAQRVAKHTRNFLRKTKRASANLRDDVRLSVASESSVFQDSYPEVFSSEEPLSVVSFHVHLSLSIPRRDGRAVKCSQELLLNSIDLHFFHSRRNGY